MRAQIAFRFQMRFLFVFFLSSLYSISKRQIRISFVSLLGWLSLFHSLIRCDTESGKPILDLIELHLRFTSSKIPYLTCLTIHFIWTKTIIYTLKFDYWQPQRWKKIESEKKSARHTLYFFANSNTFAGSLSLSSMEINEETVGHLLFIHCRFIVKNFVNAE